jgi:4-nitrophenyl phosphatase
VGEAGLVEAMRQAGVTVDDGHPPDAVVVGLDRGFDYEACDRAASHVRAGARFVASNADPTLPTPDGLRPGAGAIVAMIAAASGREPEVAGKPHEPMVRLVRERVTVGAVVGDRATTDGAFAAALGVPFALVASGVEEVAPDGAIRAGTLLEAVEQLVT